MTETAPDRLDPDKAVKLYCSEPEWISRTMMGGMFFWAALLVLATNPLLLPLACLFWALVEGYTLRVMRAQAGDAGDKLPVWNDWLDLMISGLTWVAVWSGHLFFLLFVATAMLLVGGTSGAIYAQSPQFVPWAGASFGLMVFLSLCVNFLSAYCMVNMAVEEKLSAGFGFATIFKRLKNRPLPLIQAWLLSLGLFGLALLVPIGSVFGIVFVPTTVFIARILSAKFLAQAWCAAKTG